MTLPQLPQDKANHFVYGFLIFVISLIIINTLEVFNIKIGGFITNYLPLLNVIIIAILREIYGKVMHNRWEILDIIATIFPEIILTFLK
jgi:hypothetical protein